MSAASGPARAERPPGPESAPGLYVHVPFCAHICPYCDFAVRTGGLERRARWVTALLREIELVAAAEHWAPFDTIYFGGGTPSILDPAQLRQIREALGEHFELARDLGTFLEANPEVHPARFRTLRVAGFHTVSLGVQSLDRERLAFLGRRHSPDQARAAVDAASSFYYQTVSVDFIYGLPGETAATLARELQDFVALDADHISAYQLSMPEGTPFGRRRAEGELVELAEDRQADAFVQVHEALAAAGYEAYELSNFARSPAHRSRHNRKYWNHTPYLGLGPSAHSFDGRRRWWNTRDTDDYEAHIARGERPVAGSETLSERDRALETLMLGLRTAEGVELAACAPARASALVEEGLATIGGGRLRCTVRGWAVADALAARLVPPVDRD